MALSFDKCQNVETALSRDKNVSRKKAMNDQSEVVVQRKEKKAPIKNVDYAGYSLVKYCKVFFAERGMSSQILVK